MSRGCEATDTVWIRVRVERPASACNLYLGQPRPRHPAANVPPLLLSSDSTLLRRETLRTFLHHTPGQIHAKRTQFSFLLLLRNVCSI